LRIKAETVAEVVQEASKKMSEPNYSAVLVGGFVQTQSPVAQYVSSHERELGGAEAVVNAIFHAALMGICFQRGYKRTVRQITFEELDSVADGNPTEKLQKAQPAISEFLEANIESKAMKDVLIIIALAMEEVS
jgi:hypothetical protein